MKSTDHEKLRKDCLMALRKESTQSYETLLSKVTKPELLPFIEYLLMNFTHELTGTDNSANKHLIASVSNENGTDCDKKSGTDTGSSASTSAAVPVMPVLKKKVWEDERRVCKDMRRGVMCRGIGRCAPPTREEYFHPPICQDQMHHQDKAKSTGCTAGWHLWTMHLRQPSHEESGRTDKKRGRNMGNARTGLGPTPRNKRTNNNNSNRNYARKPQPVNLEKEVQFLKRKLNETRTPWSQPAPSWAAIAAAPPMRSPSTDGNGEIRAAIAALQAQLSALASRV